MMHGRASENAANAARGASPVDFGRTQGGLVPLEEFQRQGFLACDVGVTLAEVQDLRTALSDLQISWATELGVPTEEYRRVVSQWTNVWERHPAFWRQLRHPALTRIAAELIGCERVRVFHDHVISKPPGANRAVPWHQDYPYWPLSEPRAVSCWFSLDDADVRSGCMHFMPGAHREGEKAAIDFLNDQKDWGARVQDVVAVPLRAGACVFHHCLSWHTTPPNTTDRERRAYIAIYMDAESTYAPQHSRWHPMNARVTVPPGSAFNDDAFPIVGGR
jgi:ectoine hydroxylase-related dioxygenase (phytanoyl-CoA dioxygenase family)